MENQKIISEYLRRSYFSVDGLWFMMVEKESSFEKALKLDEDVWRVLPKIQARKVKELLELEGNGLKDFIQAIKVKFDAEEYEYEIKEQRDSLIQISINKCPWYEILKKANREHLSAKIAESICFLELKVWVNEFGSDLTFEPVKGRCINGDTCLFNFGNTNLRNNYSL